MKSIKYILISVFSSLMLLTSCYDMNLEPKDVITTDAVFGSESGLTKYFAKMYDVLPIEDFLYRPESGFRWGNYWENAFTLDGICGEMASRYGGISGATGFSYWPYTELRELNTFIENFPNYKSKYSEADYNNYMGEARFMRGFIYFALVKRYGGVPIVTTVQDPATPDTESLKVSRNKEVDVWNFVYDELKFAMDNMKATSSRGRVNKYVAAAVMSRAMLYAGSVAKYGHYSNLTGDAVDEGLVGIPENQAENFFQKSYDASVFVAAGGYSLYRGNSDLTQNYVDVFLTYNNEDIWVKQYDLTSNYNARLKHSFDATHLPNPDFESGNEAQTYPTYDIVKLFTELPVVNEDGTPRRFSDRKEILDYLEPRALGTFYFSGMTLKGKEFDIRRGLYVSYDGTAEDAQRGSTNAPINSEDNRILQGAQHSGTTYDWGGTTWSIAGSHGNWKDGHANNSRTGMYIRKYIDYNLSVADAQLYMSTQPWKIFRYAEVLLNRAEAAYELGLIKNSQAMKDDAYACIADIRSRAGAAPHTFANAPADLTSKYGYPLDENMQYIRDERERELCYENHRWWDIRRWRTADTDLNGFICTALQAYEVLDEVKWENGVKKDSYIYILEDEPWMSRYTFAKQWYYEPIPTGELNKNENLYPQNPIY